MTHDEHMQLLKAHHEAELLRSENAHLKAMLAQTQAYAGILERGIEGTRANLASAHDINRTLQQYIGELERQVEQARQVARTELAADWPSLPELDGIDRFSEYPVTGE